MPPATGAPRPPAAASARLALALSISVVLVAGCGADRSDTPSEVSRYCERYRAYVRADERSTRETDPDRAVATRIAIQEMVDFVSRTRGLTRHEAYQLVSVAGHVAVTQLVDKPTMGVHVRLPKNLFRSPAR